MGRVDELRGFKENVILGHLIPGGTGFPLHRYLKLVPQGEAISDEEMEKLREAQRRKHEELYGIPSSGIPGEEADEADEPAFSVVQDDGDNSADGDDAEPTDSYEGAPSGDDGSDGVI